MHKQNKKERLFAPGVGIAPMSPLELSEEELVIFNATYKEHTHLSTKDGELVAQYAIKMVLCRSLERHIAANGARVPTRTGGSKRSPEAVVLADTQKALTSLQRALALTEEEKRRQGIIADVELVKPFIELARKRGVRKGLEGELLERFILQDLQRLGLANSI